MAERDEGGERERARQLGQLANGTKFRAGAAQLHCSLPLSSPPALTLFPLPLTPHSPFPPQHKAHKVDEREDRLIAATSVDRPSFCRMVIMAISPTAAGVIIGPSLGRQAARYSYTYLSPARAGPIVIPTD